MTPPHRHNLTHVLHNSTMSAFTVTSALAARVAAPKAARSARRSTVVRAAEEPVVVDATTEIPAKPVYVLAAQLCQPGSAEFLWKVSTPQTAELSTRACC